MAITAGLIIFPACFTYGVDQTSGPSLIFITLPNIFANMPYGRLWGKPVLPVQWRSQLCLQYLAVFENIICCGMELTGASRKKSSLVNLFLIIVLSVLAYWATMYGAGTASHLRRSSTGFRRFLVSNLFLPLGSLVYLLFCVTRYGWGWENYKTEVNTGKGLKVHDWMRGYLTYGPALIVIFIFLFGIYD